MTFSQEKCYVVNVSQNIAKLTCVTGEELTFEIFLSRPFLSTCLSSTTVRIVSLENGLLQILLNGGQDCEVVSR